ncbi:MAG: DUF4331 family protein [Deltaproteobacteria bacterium]|nr:DUF4331 family protein [Deltaproteobacteria bacterium]
MKARSWLSVASTLAVVAFVGATHHVGHASDHDDGETDIKSRALNLTDHYAFKSPSTPTELSLVMYFNPRSLPGKQYFMSTNARYELHVSKVATRTTAPTGAENYVFRFEAGAPNAAGVQSITLTVLKDGVAVGTSTGTSTGFAASKANTIVTNTGAAGGVDLKWFVGQRSDSFHFDVVRFFQVRNFLAARFFGGAGGNGNASAGLAPNCRGDAFLANLLPVPATGEPNGPDADLVNLFNPPSCAPDFVKDLNVTAIVLNVPIAQLGGGTIFDSWSTISVGE